MLENATRHSSPAAAPSARGDAHDGAVQELTRELRAAGVEPHVIATRVGCTAGGVTLRIALGEMIAHGDDALWQRILSPLREGVPVTLGLTALGAGDAAIGALEAFLNELRARLAAGQLAARGIGISLASHVVPLEAYRLLSSVLLGEGPRYVLLDGLQMRPSDDLRALRAAEHNWRFLWRCRGGRLPLVPAYAASVTTRCPLLADEAATTVLPVLGLQVPPGSAWLPLGVRLTDFSDGGGHLQWERLAGALAAAVELGEELLDRLCWPAPGLAQDAADNRRLAIELTGLGDLVAERGADPSGLACLRWLDGVVDRVHALLWARSRALARVHGPLPSLLRSEPALGWSCPVRRNDWQARWRRALADSAVRHRNLLVLSPYAVLPRDARCALAYLDLLPVLGRADAFAFAAPPAACFGSAAAFARFHRRAFAVIERRHAASLVAAGV
ncbi:MAG TPA: hypothetical protein VF200_08270 [Woeseiaceae bacterium]